VHLTADTKRERNVGIGLAKLRLPAELIRRVLLGLTYRVELPAAPAATPASSAADEPAPTTAETSAPSVEFVELQWDQLSLLEDLLPNPDTDEVSRAKAFRGNISRLSEAGKFWVAVADVPRARARASALAYQRQFDARTSDAQQRLACIVRACEQVRSSPRLRRVLLAIRQLGNKLNANEETSGVSGGGITGSASKSGAIKNGGSGAGVVAFRLDSLLKLSHTKAFNAKTTVLHFLVSQLARRDGDCLLLSQDMPDAVPAARLSLDSVRSDVAALKHGLLAVEKLVREQAKLDGGWGRLRGGSAVASASATPPQVHDRARSNGAQGSSSPAEAYRKQSSESPDAAIAAIAAAADACLTDGVYAPRKLQGEALADFVGRAQQQLEALQAGADACRIGFSEVLDYLAEDPSMSVDSFFSILSAFLAALRRAQAENAEDESKRVRELKRQSSRMVVALPVGGSGPDSAGLLSTPSAASGTSDWGAFSNSSAAADSANVGDAVSSAAIPPTQPAQHVSGVGVSVAAVEPLLLQPDGRPGLASLLAGRSMLRPRPQPVPVAQPDPTVDAGDLAATVVSPPTAAVSVRRLDFST
jgi:hypothetical protein